jgi:16S rRNA (adenine1518-N6/adenine1519-N6)-dimethyltransferase
MRELLAKHHLSPRKALGQHFLADPNIVRRIVRLSNVDESSRVLEVGAGTGTLTRSLAATGARVVAYEVDSKLAPALRESVAGLENVEIRMADAADMDVSEFEGEWSLVANLPYHVGTPLLLDLLRYAPAIRSFVVMVQREVAARLAASPGGRQYGLPTVVAGLHAEVKIAFTVPPHVFVPPPKVSSAVVTLNRRGDVSPDSERAINLAAAGFAQRRKMLRSALRSVFDDPIQVCETAGIDPPRRAESLATSDWLALAQVAP